MVLMECSNPVVSLNQESALGTDERNAGTPLALTFRGALRPDQQPAAEQLLAHEEGVLAAATAFGKTVVAAWMIARRRANTLVLVHRRQLMDQWQERLAAFLVNLSSRLKQRSFSETEFYLSMSRKDIGNYLGLTIETISRTFSRFQSEGLLTTQRKYVKILKLHELKNIAGLAPDCNYDNCPSNTASH